MVWIGRVIMCSPKKSIAMGFPGRNGNSRIKPGQARTTSLGTVLLSGSVLLQSGGSLQNQEGNQEISLGFHRKEDCIAALCWGSSRPSAWFYKSSGFLLSCHILPQLLGTSSELLSCSLGLWAQSRANKWSLSFWRIHEVVSAAAFTFSWASNILGLFEESGRKEDRDRAALHLFTIETCTVKACQNPNDRRQNKIWGIV